MATAKPIVFVVDDDAWVREALETLIRDEGLQPETFASAQEFLDRQRTSTSPDRECGSWCGLVRFSVGSFF